LFIIKVALKSGFIIGISIQIPDKEDECSYNFISEGFESFNTLQYLSSNECAFILFKSQMRH